MFDPLLPCCWGYVGYIPPGTGNKEQAYGKIIHLPYIELDCVPNILRMTMMIIANLHHQENQIVVDDTI